MKKFEIKKKLPNSWILSHHEFPKFTCEFENGKFNLSRTLMGLDDPLGNHTEVKLLQKMEQWLLRYHKDKMI
ncbi:hypothetical protein GON26_01655 [Flavobacterium sp. GA093]|uniref:Uncharacterized protein n=1 Tax=Flavobacterium hydrocarbonoxydans TaxID=2683249 RepID=A0A6I4NPC3_9FLAO|nr:hypothetical protein [Flavobacterium hydrocarbonoxydans]MWB93054.1 hypothetical protein [Flavobacterium hydrocarbonoxydans]